VNSMLLVVNVQILFKFRPQEVGRFTQYWQLTVEPLAASSNTARMQFKFELCGQVGIFGFLLTDCLKTLCLSHISCARSVCFPI